MRFNFGEISVRAVKPGRAIAFPPFRLDLLNGRLCRDEQVIALRPKAFALLQCLLERPGQLVTKEQLLDHVWPETSVSDAVLKGCIRELREVLGDEPAAPRFIETAHRRGYRFIGKISEDSELETSEPDPSLRLAPSLSLQLQTLVGRDQELAQLRGWLERSVAGERQVVFVTGEPGIGKTTLVEAFLQQAASNPGVSIARGQCLDHYGAGEAYLPVLEAVGRLCREPGGERFVTLLAERAPTWLAQMPDLASPAEREALQRHLLGATPQRMLREMAEAFEALASQTVLVLVLEDLHWSDYSTLDLVSYLARRREPARLLLVSTYRPVELILSEHPLKAVKQELVLHRKCAELALEFLTEDAVSEYLAARFPVSQLPAKLSHLIHQRTDGNPLFMVNVVDYLLARKLVVETDGRWELKVKLEELEVGVPESIHQMIEKQVDRLSLEQQQMLEAASVVGVEFSAAAVAAALEEDMVVVEDRCEGLARRHQFLHPMTIAEWPDGTVTARYAFVHALYQSVLYNRVLAARRRLLHQRIGERSERAYRDRAGEIAAELAMHFEQGRDYVRTVKYLRQAAENHSRRHANREAIGYLNRALDLVKRLPELQRAQEHMAALEQFGMVRRSMGDLKGAADVFAALAACAREQSQVDEEVKALIREASVTSWVDRERSLTALERALALSPQVKDELLRAHAHSYWGHWYSRFRTWRGEDAQACVSVIAAAREAGERRLLSLHVARYPYYQVLRSDYRAACRTAEEGLHLAVEVGDVFDYMYCQYYWAWALLHVGEWGEMLRILGDGTRMAERNEHRLASTLFQLELAWLHEQAFDFARACELCERGLAEARQSEHETNEWLSLILLGIAHSGLGHGQRALNCFKEITRRVDGKHGLMEWIFQMPLRQGLSEYWLAQEKFDQARQEAERVCQLAAPSGERTYLALGHRTLAEIALAGKDWDQTEAELRQALGALEGSEAPLAEWRVYATVAQFHQQRGHKAEAKRYWVRSAATINRLARSLVEAEELRASLLKHPQVKTILRHAGRG
jgi:DNA-binding winged helix-turn-helix (wHTH) protein/tetratricopeptide (TPR) repeat protein